MRPSFIIALGIVFIALFLAQLATGDKHSFHPQFNSGKDKFEFGAVYAYPPGVGILSNSKNCMSCHVNNGPWKDNENLIIDILDKETKTSLRQPDGSFLIE